MRARPLARRFLRIARPARVFIRARKPCLRLRRRVFGWKVRLVTEPSSTEPTPHPRHHGFPHREFFGRSGGRASIAARRVCPCGATGSRARSANDSSPLTRASPGCLPWPRLEPPAMSLGGCGTSPELSLGLGPAPVRRQYSTAVEKPVERREIPAQTRFSRTCRSTDLASDLHRWTCEPEAPLWISQRMKGEPSRWSFQK